MAKKPRYTLMKASPDDTDAALSAADPASAVADLFIYAGMKAGKKAERLSELALSPGQIAFDNTNAHVHVHDGKQIIEGVPSCLCPDCGGEVRLQKKFFNVGPKASPWFYICENHDGGCKVVVGARVDGSMIGKPVDAETRRARRLTTEQFDRLWKEAPEYMAASGSKEERKKVENTVRAKAYRWLAARMKEAGQSEGNIPKMDIPTLRVAYKICRNAAIAEVQA